MKTNKNFLNKIAQKLFAEHQDELSSIVVVFPSRRAHVYFTEELSNTIKKPIWLPRFYSIEDLFFHVLNYSKISKLELFFQFYNIYKTSVKDPQSLDQCYKWAVLLLEDFNEIDQDCVDYIKLFNHLSDLKRLDSWDLNINTSSEHIYSYLSFFKELRVLYEKLRLKLTKHKLSYSGLTQRLLSESPASISDWMKKNNYKKIVFVGLDALTVAQEKIINYLLTEKLCNVYWDTDHYFINNPRQESGKFLRKYRKRWPELFTDVNNDFIIKPKTIKLFAASKNIVQSKLLGDLLLDKKYSRNDIKRVAIILPNESLLLPVLESIPSFIKDINVTMGYNLINHPIVSIYFDLLEIYVNQKIVQTPMPEHILRTIDLFRVLENPYCNSFAETANSLSDVLLQLKKSGLKYINKSQFNQFFNNTKASVISDVLLKTINNVHDVINVFEELTIDILELIKNKNSVSNIESQCLFEIDDILQSLANLLKTLEEDLDLKTFYILFKDIIKSRKLNFIGEPLKGIQIMGLLEARTIDFDEVFLLSANEGHLPPVTMRNSFIPVEVRFAFSLRTYLDRDAIYANHFFNLIKRPDNIHILYNNDNSSSSFSTGEKSRFLQQLIYEVNTYNNHNMSIVEDFVATPFQMDSGDSKIAIKKDKFIINRLNRLSSDGFSASAINLYFYCKRQFYFEKILQIKEDKLDNINLDTVQMGLVIHYILKQLYQPYLEKQLTIQSIKSMQTRVSDCLDVALSKHNIQEVKKGKNFLAIKAMERIIKNFLLYELNDVKKGNKIIIKYLDDKNDFPPQPLSLQTTQNTVRIKGIIDRIDTYNNQYRIIDYKTGSVKKSELHSLNFSDLQEKPKLLQLLLYALLFNKNKKHLNSPIVAGIINLRAKSFQVQYCSINQNHAITQEVLGSFEQKLGDLILQILDPSIDIKHVNRSTPCRFCD